MEDVRIYIAGPMSGIPEYNRPAFEEAELRLRSRGHVMIFNPIESEMSEKAQAGEFPSEEAAYRHCMKMDLDWICDYADKIYFLKGWENSKGARAEHALAVALGIEIEYQ